MPFNRTFSIAILIIVLGFGAAFFYLTQEQDTAPKTTQTEVTPPGTPVVTLPALPPAPTNPTPPVTPAPPSKPLPPPTNPPTPPPPVNPPADEPPQPPAPPPPVNPPADEPPQPPPPPTPTPPTPQLSGSGGDSTISLSYGASAGVANKTPFSYVILAAYDPAFLESIALEDFSTPPFGAAVVTLSITTPGSLFIGDVLNNQTVFFRLRACDASIPAQCATTNALGVAPKLKKVAVSLGEPETVFDWTTDRCNDLDLPDSHTRALRMTDDSLFLLSANAPAVYRMTGSTFQNLTRDCNAPILTSSQSADPWTFENWEWLWSVYRIGSKIHALIHNEYHDPASSVCTEGELGPANPCWWNSITAAYSTDNGASFNRYNTPFRVIAALPSPWNPESAGGKTPNVMGYLTPSNIVKHTDGYYYAFIDSDTSPTLNAAQAGGYCVMRTVDLSTPDNWRAWDGSAFSIRMDPPYSYPNGEPSPTGKPFCKPVGATVMPGFGLGSVTYNTHLSKYMAVGYGKFKPAGSVVCGFYLSTSSNLTHWSEPQLILAGNFPQGGACPSKGEIVGTYNYASLIDHDSPDINFETADSTAHLYYVIHNGGLDRDLVRRSVIFTAE